MNMSKKKWPHSNNNEKSPMFYLTQQKRGSFKWRQSGCSGRNERGERRDSSLANILCSRSVMSGVNMCVHACHVRAQVRKLFCSCLHHQRGEFTHLWCLQQSELVKRKENMCIFLPLCKHKSFRECYWHTERI